MTLVTQENIAEVLKNDIKVRVAGVDADGILRGKIMSKEKFLSSVKSGFGFSSAIFGWDMHDALYTHGTGLSSEGGGYADFIAKPDLASFRRLPWESNIPFFLLHFNSEGKPVSACPRGMTRAVVTKLEQQNFKAVAGVELEFVNFQTPTEDGYGPESNRPNLAAFLLKNAPKALRPLTEGMFGYSVTRPVASKDYFHEVFDTSAKFNCHVEGWHTESGPGVFEAALAACDVAEMADRVSMFKLLTKSIAIDHGITPCFMAKPLQGLPGNSGHVHVSLTDGSGTNMFTREEINLSAKWSDLEYLSDTGCYFLAGILDALPDIMPLLAPTVNSYKRFVENFWAPVAITWGNEDRLSSIRLITPPVCKPSGVRLEIRIPGADLHPHYALSAIFSAGLRGIQKKLEITVPPSSARTVADGPPTMLANTLSKALDRFSAPTSVARELFEPEFVDFFTASRQHELKVWREAVTDW
ncbi:Fc.00g043290.m01.CDS01 [Cosmosporella sp. VM-42]